MVVRPLADEARLESAVVIFHVLSNWAGRRPWRLFGSWAIFLHSTGNTRVPQDVDVEVLADDDTWIRDLPVWPTAGLPYRCAANEPRRINFSRPDDSPAAYWQDIAVARGPTWLSTETINWVWRGPDHGAADVVMINSQRAVRPELGAWDHPVGVPCAPLEECLALKWTRISRPRSGGRRHTRWIDLADLYDVLVLRKARVSDDLLRLWILRLGSERGISSPFLLPPPPLEWLDAWDYYNFRTGTQRPKPEEAAEILNGMFMTSSHCD